MSQPKQYSPALEPGRGSNFNGLEVSMREDLAGKWVSLSDYAALAAENERLKQPWVKILTESETWKAQSEVARLNAENERLRKAGDAMAESIKFDDQRTWEDWGNQGKSLLRDCVIDWIIAKRGDEK